MAWLGLATTSSSSSSFFSSSLQGSPRRLILLHLPHIFIAATSCSAFCLFSVTVSEAYRIHGLTTILQTFPFILADTFLSHSKTWYIPAASSPQALSFWTSDPQYILKSLTYIKYESQMFDSFLACPQYFDNHENIKRRGSQTATTQAFCFAVSGTVGCCMWMDVNVPSWQ